VFDDRGAGVFGALAWDDADAGGGTFERALERQGGIPRSPCLEGERRRQCVAAKRAARPLELKPGRQENTESEQFACGVAEKGEILCEMASFGDALEEAVALLRMYSPV